MSSIFVKDLPTIEDKYGHKRRHCIARCSYCGVEYQILKQNLKSKKSCGCMTSKLLSRASTKHGYRHMRLYQTWVDMKSRCLNVNSSSYKNYGGRGIFIYDKWLDFSSFKSWADNHGYDDSLTIERINNNDGYYPENCTWSTLSDQQNNKRTTINIEGFTSLSKWAEHHNLPYHAVLYRFKAGWTINEIKNIPIGKHLKKKKCKLDGCKEKHCAKGFCQKHYNHYRRGIL